LENQLKDIEITSPGGMVSRKEIQNLDLMSIPSQRRNPIVADVFGRMDYMERRGSGFRKIYLGFQNSINFREERLPKFYSQLDFFRATLFNLNYGVSLEDQIVVMDGQARKEIGAVEETGSVTVVENQADVGISGEQSTRENSTGKISTRENSTREISTREKILLLIKSNPTITMKEIALALNLSEKGIEWQIKQLRQSGTIKRIGGDRGGKWEIIHTVN
jgi:ATP-dependent DNA helicase RecG